MRAGWRLALGLSVVVLGAAAAESQEPVRVNDLKDNVRARLVGAKQSEARGRWVIARFETLDATRKEVRIVFPAHSFTTHERTLLTLIEGSVDERGQVKAGIEVVFSIPANGASPVQDTSLERCYLHSLKLGEAK